MKEDRYCEERIIRDLKKICARYRKMAKALAEERITVEYKGEEYASYQEIQDAFGAGVITLKRFDLLAKELDNKIRYGNSRYRRESLENSEDMLGEYVCELSRRLKVKRERNETELNRTEREANATRLFLAYRELVEKDRKKGEQ